ncbi:MAG: thiamine pyrophosphate-dependent enzyme [Candidatus Bathyarchaeota archaeon]|jgi:2-oxoglutarate ferredoxin oxidoreductase subunit beta
MTKQFSVKDYLRDLELPFCAGCGIYTITNSFLKAIFKLNQKSLDNYVFCSGIGCSAWISSPYFMADSIHTPHGRSIPVATGIKLVRPNLNVVVFGGDGDIVGIGLSHFIHAARRNLDVLVIMINNMIYGMTGGQSAPTTPFKTKTKTTPYGNFERPLDTAKLAATAGACYSARWTTAHPNQLSESIKKGLQMKGFRFIEVLSQCPTAYGRRAGFKNVTEILRWFKETAVSIRESKMIDEEELEGRIVIGEFVQRKLPTLDENLYMMMQEVKRNTEQD